MNVPKTSAAHKLCRLDQQGLDKHPHQPGPGGSIQFDGLKRHKIHQDNLVLCCTTASCVFLDIGPPSRFYLNKSPCFWEHGRVIQMPRQAKWLAPPCLLGYFVLCAVLPAANLDRTKTTVHSSALMGSVQMAGLVQKYLNFTPFGSIQLAVAFLAGSNYESRSNFKTVKECFIGFAGMLKTASLLFGV